MMQNKHPPHPVDIYAGQMLRDLRVARKMNQKDLGQALSRPVTFQQMQKYEKATNRMSASRIFEFAEVLSVEPCSFFPQNDNETMPTFSKQEVALIMAMRHLPSEIRKPTQQLILHAASTHGLSVSK